MLLPRQPLNALCLYALSECTSQFVSLSHTRVINRNFVVEYWCIPTCVRLQPLSQGLVYLPQYVSKTKVTEWVMFSCTFNDKCTQLYFKGAFICRKSGRL